MDFKPQTFFIGVIDFFSVLLPGALLTYFFMGMYYTDFFGAGKIFPVSTDITVKWIIFLVITYIIGNIIFMLASFLDASYNKTLRKIFFQSPYDLSFKTARLIKEIYFNVDASLMELVEKQQLTQAQYKNILNNKNREIFNTFKWAQHFLLFNQPEALADIKRTEADSKFFRSLVITFLLMAFILLTRGNSTISIAFIILSALCYYRFGDLRFKATEKAYEMVITYHNLNAKENKSINPSTIDSSTIKTDIEKDFEWKHHNRVNNLIKGFSNKPKQVVINRGELNNVIFQSTQNEYWYCLEGKGIMLIKNDDVEQEHFLQSNAAIQIAKGKKYSFQNKIKEGLKLIVINK